MFPKIIKAKSRNSTARLSVAFNEHLPPGNELPAACPTGLKPDVSDKSPQEITWPK